MISYVFKIDPNEYDHECGLDMIPFPGSMQALDFAAEVAESLNSQLWEEACESCDDDYRHALDYFNDISGCSGDPMVKLVSGHNSREYMLGKG